MRMTRRAIADANVYEVLKNVDIVFRTQELLVRLVFELCRKR